MKTLEHIIKILKGVGKGILKEYNLSNEKAEEAMEKISSKISNDFQIDIKAELNSNVSSNLQTSVINQQGINFEKYEEQKNLWKESYNEKVIEIEELNKKLSIKEGLITNYKNIIDNNQEIVQKKIDEEYHNLLTTQDTLFLDLKTSFNTVDEIYIKGNLFEKTREGLSLMESQQLYLNRMHKKLRYFKSCVPRIHNQNKSQVRLWISEIEKWIFKSTSKHNEQKLSNKVY